MENINDILELHNHLILNDCFKKHLIEDSKPKVYTYPSNGNYQSNYDLSRDRCNCKFYEWSDLTREPREFRLGRDFFKFLDESNIKYTEKNKSDFNIYYNFYATCIQGKNELLLCKDFSTLKEEFKNTL